MAMGKLARYVFPILLTDTNELGNQICTLFDVGHALVHVCVCMLYACVRVCVWYSLGQCMTSDMSEHPQLSLIENL